MTPDAGRDARWIVGYGESAVTPDVDRLVETVRATLVRLNPKPYLPFESHRVAIAAAHAALDSLRALVSQAQGERDAYDTRITELESTLEQREIGYGNALGSAEQAEARVRVLEEALDEALDIIVWMSGADDFGPGGQAIVGWEKARDRLDPLFALVRGRAALAETGER